jgi:tubulin-folding cofactor B
MAEVEEERHPWQQAFRDYVTLNDETRYDGMVDGAIRLDITHSNLEQRWHDILVWSEMTVFELKEKLYRHCGSHVTFVDLYLRRGQGTSNTVYLGDENKTLGYYGAANGMHLHMVDNDPNSISAGGWLENVDLVEKFHLTDAEYDARENTVRAYKKKMMAKDPTFKFGKKEHTEKAPEVDLTPYVVDARCEVNPGGRRGTVKFVGPLVEDTPDEEGVVTKVMGAANIYGTSEITFVGIQLDEPTGHNDGMINGQRYFECPPKYGLFAKPHNVTIGDFPELDPFADLESDDEI